MIRSLVESSARTAWSAVSYGLPKGDHIVRYSMYKKLQALVQPQDMGDRVLSISHSTDLFRLLGASQSSIEEANYPDQRIDHLSVEPDSFSAGVSDQVLEHIEYTPKEAINEVWRVLNSRFIRLSLCSEV
jgi:hypothetical protein